MAIDLDDTREPHELADIAHRLRVRKWLGLAAGIIMGIGLVVLLIVLSSLLNASTRQTESSDRADCKTQYNSILARPVTERDNLSDEVSSVGGDLNSQLGAALLQSQSGQPVTPSQVAAFLATKTHLDQLRPRLLAAINVVNSLPTLNRASTNGFTFDGTKYPPCPVVAGSKT